MTDDLYQADIMAWAKKCKDAPLIGNIDYRATAHNPLCGDRITVELKIENDAIADISCQVKGCMLCKASSAHMADLLRGRSKDAANELHQALQTALKNAQAPPAAFPESHRLFYPVKTRKSRHTCVLLPYQAVLDALSSEETIK